MSSKNHYSIESFGGGYLVADYSGNRGAMGAAYCGSDGVWQSQPIIQEPFPNKEAAESFISEQTA